MLRNRITWALLAFAAAAAPLPFGSTDPETVTFWVFVLGVAVAAGRPLALERRHLFLVLLAVVVAAAFAFVIHEQVSRQAWLASAHPIWSDAAKALDQPLDPLASIARNQPWLALGVPLVSLLTITAAFVCGMDRILAWRLMRTVAWSGAALALFAIVAFIIEPDRVLWRAKIGHAGLLTGTFLNRNTAATYFGTCSIIWLMIVLETVRQKVPSARMSLMELAHHFSAHYSRQNVVPTFMLLLCMSAMALTLSRAGVILSILALITVATLTARPYLPNLARFIVVLLIGAAGGFTLLLTLGAGVSGRLDIEGLAGGGRFETYWSTLSLIADHPWFGTGLGTYSMAFPAYRSASLSLWGVWDRAHNTLLELASDAGLPLAVLVAVGLVTAMGYLLHGAINRRRDQGLPIAGLAVALLGALHSLVDFSLQIAGYAIPYFAIVGVALAQSFSRRRREGSGRSRSERYLEPRGT